LLLWLGMRTGSPHSRAFYLIFYFIVFVLGFSAFGSQGSSRCQALIEKLSHLPRVSEPPYPSLEEMERRTAQGSLFTFKQNSGDSLFSHNQNLMTALEEPKRPPQPEEISGIDGKQADQLIRSMTEHPTHGTSKASRFDPKGVFGFCFGRALIIHHQALIRNVNPHDIKKIWAIGPMEGGKWGWHVSTLIKKSGERNWWACDPIFDIAVGADAWMRKLSRWSDDGRLMFFVTKASRFSVFHDSDYSPIDLLGDGKTDFYNGYFKEYLDHELAQPN
jgi:hypothetical protein